MELQLNATRLLAHVALFLVLGMVAGTPPAVAWGCKGHQTVALIAEGHLAPEARRLVEKLLEEYPVEPEVKRNCGSAIHDLLADGSTWPDDVRNERKNGSWHYIDIPRGAPRRALADYCGAEGCVTKAITEQWAVLKDRHAEPRRRAEAIRYLIHFVADLHMPLHASTNNDLGGRCVPVHYLRRRPHQTHDSFSPNLHAIWDTDILERDMEGADPAEFSDYLEQSFTSEMLQWQKAGIRIEDWAWESHDLAESVAYGGLRPQPPVEAPVSMRSCADDNLIGERLFHMQLTAGQAYQDAAAPVIEKRLAQAGLRLAMILNNAAGSAVIAN